jgi:hypothetical protein
VEGKSFLEKLAGYRAPVWEKAFNGFCLRIVIVHSAQVRIILPDFRAWSTNIRDESIRILNMNLSDSCC